MLGKTENQFRTLKRRRRIKCLGDFRRQSARAPTSGFPTHGHFESGLPRFPLDAWVCEESAPIRWSERRYVKAIHRTPLPLRSSALVQLELRTFYVIAAMR